MNTHISGDYLERPKLEFMIMSLVLVVENLRDPGYLTTVLQQLGERHVRYGAMREHYPLVGAALLKTFASSTLR